MKLDQAAPHAALRGYVRCFQQREADFTAASVVFPLAARPAQILEFYLQERYVIHYAASGAVETAPRAVVVGPATYRRADLVLPGHLLVFTIQFQASGFHQLFRLPVADLVDRAYEAQSMIGSRVTGLEQRLADAGDFEERVRLATAFLLRYRNPGTTLDPVAIVANRALAGYRPVRVAQAAHEAGLSTRQFERRFAACVGVSPGQYAAIIRFDRALAAKLAAPTRLWTDIAQDVGYYDQMHLVRAFAGFAGESPTRYFRRILAMPRHWA
jgi:AraC-like DNA-binding protein